MGKKILSLILSVCMVFTVLGTIPLQAFAENELSDTVYEEVTELPTDEEEADLMFDESGDNLNPDLEGGQEPDFDGEDDSDFGGEEEPTHDIYYQEILSYYEYEMLEYEFGEDPSYFEGMYYLVSGVINGISGEEFTVSTDEEGLNYVIRGSVSEDLYYHYATVYCFVDVESEYLLTMERVEAKESYIVEITSEEQLRTVEFDYAKKYMLKNNIQLTENWEPRELLGEFDGCGYTISGINVISDQEYTYDYAGLFSVNNGTIKNLNVETGDGSVLAVRGSTASAGILAGLNNGTIENCYVEGNVEGSVYTGGLVGRNAGVVLNSHATITIDSEYGNIGGLVGYNTGEIIDSYAEAYIYGDSYVGILAAYNYNGSIVNSYATGEASGSDYVGGLAGYSQGGEITSSYAIGEVSGSSYVGGLVGNNATAISDCYSECNVIGRSENVGGLCGWSNANITNSHAQASVVGSGNYVGGLVGRSSYGTFADCYFAGAVKSGSSYVGGLIGYAEATVNINDSYARATVQGGSYVGGLIGYCYYSANITRCYTDGGIIASGNYAGGLVGRYYARSRTGYIQNSFSNADVWANTYAGGLIGYFEQSYSLYATNNYATGDVDGANYVGGIIGYQNSGAHFTNNYAIGKVSKVSASGGITGWRSGVESALIEKCYYDIETTGMETGEDGIGKTTEQMKKEETYLTWDFDSVWGIDPEINNGYPHLQDNHNVNTQVQTVITTEEELRAITNDLSGSYILDNDIELTEDWETIGDSNLAFYGVLDGNGYTISNLNIDSEDSALIHSIAVSGVVKNLNVVIGDGVTASDEAGGIAVNNYGVIDNCYVKGNVNAFGNAGGIAANNYSEITASHMAGSVTGGSYTGGIAGYQTNGTIEDCSVTGVISGGQYVGGAVGYTSGGSLIRVATGGSVVCDYTVNSNCAAGGLVGYFDADTSSSYTIVDECYSTANVAGYYYVGGLIGTVYANGDSNKLYPKYIENSYSMGAVRGSSYVGSFIGRVYYDARFINCYTASNSYVSTLSIYDSAWKNQESSYHMSDYASGATLFAAKTSDELKTQETFEGWNFDAVWQMSPAINNGMPYLKNAPELTADAYVLIQSEDDLISMANNLTGMYLLATDIVISSPWEMIGSEDAPFEGVFDGNGFTITNYCADDNGTVYPLFDTIGKNGIVRNVVINTSVNTDQTTSMAAGLVLVNEGNIENVTVNGSIKGSNDYVGGIAAKNNGTIYQCSVEADIEGLSYVGGIAGKNSGSIIESKAYKTVTAQVEHAGGIAGYFSGGNILYCGSYNAVYGGNNVGGVAGYMEGQSNIRYSYSKGEVGSYPGTEGMRFGGMVGYLYSSYGSTQPIRYSYSSATVKGSSYVGGFIGELYSYTSSYLYISNCYADGEVSGSSTVGSFIGRSHGSWSSIYIQNCYSAIKCGGYSSVSYRYDTNFENCYFNTSTSGKTSDSYFKALSDSEFKLKESFENWDFDTIWAIEEGVNNSYPYIKKLGTEDYEVQDTYEYTLIHNEEELFQIKKNLEGKYKLANDIEITDTWQPIGDSEEPFNGILDGDGYKIYNFHILQNEEYEYALAGLFGSVGRLGEVRNLTVETSEYGVATLNVGKYAGIVTAINYGKLENCHVSGNVRATDTSGGIAAINYGRIVESSANIIVTTDDYAGGIAGENSGSIQNCTVTGNIVSTAGAAGGVAANNNGGYINKSEADDIYVEGADYVGGIVGNGGTVYECTADGEVHGANYVGSIAGSAHVVYSTATGTINATGDCIGGIVGSTGSSITECSFTGEIMADYSSSDYVGGIAGESSAGITNSYADVTIIGHSYIGGIAGRSTSSVSNCEASVNITGLNRVGGIAGEATGSVSSCCAEGAIVAGGNVGGLVGYLTGSVTASFADCSISGRENVGGLIGYTSSTVTNSYSLSNVNGIDNVGGFAGNISENGSVTLCFAKGDVVGNDNVGGFAGYNAGFMQYNYSIGKVTANGENAGGLLGYLAGRILNSYYNSETSGMADTGKGIPKSGEQMKKEATYVGWDFEDVWMLDSDINNGYPYFEGYEDKAEEEASVTEISTKEDFYAISENPGGHYILVNDIELDENIASLGVFEGTLDGNGYKVYGFSMDFSDTTYGGLFSELRAGARIENLTVEYDTIASDDTVTAAGALVGRNYGTITNCLVNGDIEGYINIGGVAGYNYSIIENTTVAGTVWADSYAGGLVGNNNMSIYNCQSNAAVYGNRTTGGLVGYDSSGYIRLSSATGSVSRNNNYETEEKRNIGGLVGYASYTSVERSFASSAVTGEGYVGGLVGYAYYAEISSSASTAVVTSGSYAGGFIGYSYYGAVDNSYATGEVTGSGSYTGGFVGCSEYTTYNYSYAAGEVTGSGYYTGGFAGRADSGSISDCYVDSAVAGNYYTGGFVGYAYNMNISNCYVDGTVEEYSYTGGYIGGFTGYNYRYVTYSSCYARNKITGNYGFAYYSYGPSSMSNCYYDATNNSCTDSYAMGKAAEELMAKNQYINWNLDSAWVLDKEVSEYPYLSWQNGPGDLPTVIPTVSVEIVTDAYAVNVGEALALTLNLYPSNATDKVEWISSNENVAIVKEDGTVIAVSEGIAEITVISGTASATVEIEVLNQEKSGNIVKVVTETALSVPYGTTLDQMLVMLPSVVEVMLSTGVIASLEASWRYNEDTEYEFTATVSIPDGVNITNTNNITAAAYVEMEPEKVPVREIATVPQITLGVVNGTSLSTVLSMLPEGVEVTLNDNSEEEVSVAWSEQSEPYYNGFTSGEYTFTGTIILPGDGSIKNTEGLSIKATIKVAAATQTVKNITSAMAQNNILIENYTTINDVLAMFPSEVYAVLDGAQTVSLPVTWSSVSEPAYSPRVAGTYTFYGAFILSDDANVTNTLNIRPTIKVVISSTVTDEKAITVTGKTAEIGSTTSVSVTIDENTNMASGSIVIDYDTTLLTPTAYEIGEVIESTSALVNINYIDPVTQERKVKVSWFGANEINKGGEIVNITFLVSEGATDGEQITVSVKDVVIEDMDLNLIPTKIINGTINAVAVVLGDINGDGNVTIQDAFRILLMDIGRITFTDKQNLAADVNRDGVVDIFDAMKIQRYDIGLADTLN